MSLMAGKDARSIVNARSAGTHMKFSGDLGGGMRQRDIDEPWHFYAQAKIN